MTESAESNKEKAARALNQRPETFRWAIEGTVYTRDELIKRLETEPASGTTITDLAQRLRDLTDGTPTNMLGKRYRCLVCRTEALATKSGEGKISCCGQLMEVMEPRPLASSD